MVLLDVNVLVYAHREDAPNHQAYREWLSALINTGAAYGISDLVLSGFMRIATHRRIFNPPSSMAQAQSFAKVVRGQANCVVVSPDPSHWEIFCRLCSGDGVQGNLVPDAYLAALAIEADCEWITSDQDFGRFAGLRWRHPLRDAF
jgi:uncharacterized protein